MFIAVIPIASADYSLQEILRRTYMEGEKSRGLQKDLIYNAESHMTEKDRSGKIIREMKSQRIVYSISNIPVHEEYLSMVINGETLSKEEMETEIEKQKKSGRTGPQFRYPFSEEENDPYQYSMLTMPDQDRVTITFLPDKKENDSLQGKALIEISTGRILEMEFRPSRLPPVFEHFSIKVNLGSSGPYWIMKEFKMHIHISIGKLVNRQIFISDSYTAFRINTGEPRKFTSKT